MAQAFRVHAEVVAGKSQRDQRVDLDSALARRTQQRQRAAANQRAAFGVVQSRAMKRHQGQRLSFADTVAGVARQLHGLLGAGSAGHMVAAVARRLRSDEPCRQ
jgi:hypothetical protein